MYLHHSEPALVSLASLLDSVFRKQNVAGLDLEDRGPRKTITGPIQDDVFRHHLGPFLSRLSHLLPTPVISMGFWSFPRRKTLSNVCTVFPSIILNLTTSSQNSTQGAKPYPNPKPIPHPPTISGHMAYPSVMAVSMTLQRVSVA